MVGLGEHVPHRLGVPVVDEPVAAVGLPVLGVRRQQKVFDLSEARKIFYELSCRRLERDAAHENFGEVFDFGEVPGTRLDDPRAGD